MTEALQCRRITTLVKDDATLELKIESVPVPKPKDDEIIIKIEAAPINPSDLGLMFGPADMSKAKLSGTADEPVVIAPIPPSAMSTLSARVGQAMTLGNEGAGVVVDAGASDAAQALMGKVVAVAGGDMFAEYRSVKAKLAIPMNDGITPVQAASCFVNPMTTLTMLETMRTEGFKAIVHTAAASNLGQMLNRVCLADGISIVNIVRKPEQEKILRDLGAKYVINSSADDFEQQLTEAIAETEAYLAFDATGGGTLANTVLKCMEAAASRNTEFSRYGSETLKKVYVYGRLDQSRMELTSSYGLAFSVSGWLLTPKLQEFGLEKMLKMRHRIANEITSTFASHYSTAVSLKDALSLESIAEFGSISTGKKYLITPHK